MIDNDHLPERATGLNLSVIFPQTPRDHGKVSEELGASRGRNHNRWDEAPSSTIEVNVEVRP